MRLWCGIDWAENHNDISVVDENGSPRDRPVAPPDVPSSDRASAMLRAFLSAAPLRGPSLHTLYRSGASWLAGAVAVGPARVGWPSAPGDIAAGVVQ